MAAGAVGLIGGATGRGLLCRKGSRALLTEELQNTILLYTIESCEQEYGDEKFLHVVGVS